MSKKKELSAEQRAECEAAKALFLTKKDALGLTQAKLAAAAEISPAAVAMYLNGTNPLNARFAAVLSMAISEPVDRFSPRLAKDLAEMARAAQKKPDQIDRADRVALGKSLFNRATPRSQAIIDKIVALDAQNQLTEEDLHILEKIIERFSNSK